MKVRAGFCTLGMIAALSLFMAGNISVAEAQEKKFYEFSIEGQPLSSALFALGEKTGYVILFDARLANDKQSGGATGALTLEQALQTLLAGSGLSYRFTGEKTLTLEPAGDAKAESDVVTLEPILVTGEGVTRTVQKTASSVFVTTAEQIENAPGPQTVETVMNQAPNVLVNGTNSLAPTIRGSDSTGVLSAARGLIGGARPRSTINVDGRELSFNEYVFGRSSVWDTERVEVFLGPQTTNSGRNSISGAVFVETKDPTFDFEADTRVIVGSSNTQQYSAVVSGPLIGQELAGRLSFDSKNHDTFVTHTGLQPDFPVSYKDDDFLNARLKLLYLPEALPDLSAKLTLTRSDSLRPQSEAVNLPAENLVRSNVDHSMIENITNSAVLNLDYDINDSFSIRNVTTFSDGTMERLASLGRGNADVDLQQYSNEFYVDYQPENSPMEGVFGVSVLRSDQDEYFNTTATGTGEANFTDKQLSFGIFGEMTYALTDALDLTLGLRYQYDQQRRKGRNRGSLVNIALDYDESFSAFLPKAVLAYKINPDVTVGASVSKGFNPGGATVEFATFTTDTFDEETLINYELFLRSQWLDNRLKLNANLFYTDFKDAQRQSNFPVGLFSVTMIDNAEDARSFGAELSMEYRHSKMFSIYGSLGLLRTEIEEFSDSTAVVAGNEFQRAPSFNASLGAVFRPIEGLSVTVNGRYSDSYYSDDANTSINEVDAFFVADARVSYSYRNVEAFAYATNLFDNFYELEKRQHGTGTAFSIVGDPREVGVGLKVRF